MLNSKRHEILETFKSSTPTLLDDLQGIINTFVPQKGDSSAECVHVGLAMAIQEVESLVNGVEPEDTSPTSHCEKTVKEDEWHVENFDKGDAIDRIRDMIYNLQEFEKTIQGMS
jgi:hypothetical protein